MTTSDPAASLNPIATHQPDGTRGVADELRGAYDSGRTRPLAWRREQLQALIGSGGARG